MSERRPYTRYECSTLLEPTTIFADGETVTIPAGGFLCEVSTDDNRETGVPGSEYERWPTWARDRASFDRLVGKSRTGILHDVTVELDGERI